ncbi:unnamed protein product [Linum tenue]|uniref:Glycosyltransferase N-terminal domain-containing protein n=1 Tax=Linum tenue TaxID=586396 RepID=A0AAV0MF46_9ROSI|nr:unnamed protein product [Linum tenue]
MSSQTPHAVCIPYPAQGHINPMLKLAKLLYSRGFHITFVNTEYNHRRLLKSRRGGAAASGLFHSLPPGFNFQTIPDGLHPPTDDDGAVDATQDIPSLCDSTSKHCLAPFRDLVLRLNGVSCIVSDGSMSFTLDVAKELGIPDALFLTPSACGILTHAHFHLLAEKGLVPLKDSSYLTNGYLDETSIDFIPGLSKNIRMKHLPSFVRTTNPNDVMFNYIQREVSRVPEGSALLLNTFDALDQQILAALSTVISPNILTIGPLNLLLNQIKGHDELKEVNTNLWTEDTECIQWLDSQDPNSVLYVNFGSITVMTPQQLSEFAWGLARSGKPFLWVIRPDLVGSDDDLPLEFVEETKDRGMVAGWCCQEEILSHGAVGGFLSHMGWNSTVESLSYGVPMLCWPFFSEQLTTCFYACNEWGVGMEVDPEVRREEVEGLVRELMGGDKGKEMKRRAMEWKNKAEEATRVGGSSFQNMERLVELLLGNKMS